MPTYEISNGSAPINIAELLKKNDDSSGFIDLITTNTSNLKTKLDSIHATIKTIQIASIDKGTKTDIITNNSDIDNIKKIHFLAASIYQRLVTLCLEKMNTNDTNWDAIKTIIDTNLKLDANGADPTNFGHFYVMPLILSAGNSAANADNILMYQLLQQLIANNMTPNIDDVIAFLLKIDASWYSKYDLIKATQIKTDFTAQPVNQTEVDTYFNVHATNVEIVIQRLSAATLNSTQHAILDNLILINSRFATVKKVQELLKKFDTQYKTLDRTIDLLISNQDFKDALTGDTSYKQKFLKQEIIIIELVDLITDIVNTFQKIKTIADENLTNKFLGKLKTDTETKMQFMNGIISKKVDGPTNFAEAIFTKLLIQPIVSVDTQNKYSKTFGNYQYLYNTIDANTYTSAPSNFTL